jgi:hypothetical protein
MSRPAVVPDTKDWTWVLERPCPECGFDASAVRRVEVKNRVLANASAWQRVLARHGVGERPGPQTWSPLEYGCHVRDVHGVFAGRLRSMLAEDDPLFASWDQDDAAVEGRYGDQDAATVALELAGAAEDVAGVYGTVVDPQWERPGRRSNGSVFTIDTLARYHLHDIEHHLVDVAG